MDEDLAGKYEGQELVVQVWPGSYEEVYSEQVFGPFEELTGADIIAASTFEFFTLARLEEEVASGDPQLDVSVMLPSDVVRAAEQGLLEPISEENVPNVAKLRPESNALLPDGVGYLVYTYGFGYHTDIEEDLGFVPSCWEDLWDPRLEGSIVTGRFQAPYTVQSINMMLRGELSPVQEDVWEKLSELNPNIHSLHDSPAGMEDALVRKDAYVAIVFDGRIWTMADAGVPVEYVLPCEGTYGNQDFFSIVKGTRNLELAYDFVNFTLAEESQARIAEHLHYGPTNTSVELTEEQASRAIYGDDWNQIQMEDYEYAAANTDEWTDLWNEWVASLGG
ncbi:MAG: extracellular solute-binding protein [Acidimicrobiia bacterium]